MFSDQGSHISSPSSPGFSMNAAYPSFRRKNVLRIPHGWIYYLSSEIVKQMRPELDEDQLPFSKAADVYAFGYQLYFDFNSI